MSQTNPTNAEIDKYASHYVLNGCQSSAWRKTFPKSKAKPEVVNEKASKLHSIDKVQLRVKELAEDARKIAEAEFNLDAEYVAKRLKEIDELDILDIMEHDLNSFKPLSEWPKSWRVSISGLDLITLSNKDENIDAVVKKIKWPDKTKNLELIGKLVDVSAFSENLTVKTGGDITPWGEVKASIDKIDE